MSLVLVAAAAVSVAMAKKQQDQRAQEIDAADPLQVIAAESARHTDIHKGIDLRVTLYLLVYVSGMWAILKDGKSLVTMPFLMALFIATTIGISYCVVSLRVRSTGLEPRKAEQIIKDASAPFKAQLQKAAKQQEVLERITRAKGQASNLALYALALTCFVFMASIGISLLCA